MGLTMVIFDHVRQYMFIVGHRPPLGEWDWIKQADWNDAADNLFQHVPQLHPFTLGDDFRPIILRNHEVASRAAKMAQARGYRDGQAFNEIILNATPYPPTAYSAVRQAMGIMGYNPRPDAYFSVNTSPLPKHIESAVAQLDYAFQHYHPHTNIRVIAHTRDDLVYMGQGIAQALFYGAMSADPDWQGGIHPLVVEPPY
jgi:hypothetical protein